MLRLTARFDAAEYLTDPEARYGFLLEALEPPVSVKTLSGSVAIVARAAGGVDALAQEAGIPSAAVQEAIDAASVEAATAAIKSLLDGLRRYVPASQLVA